MRLENEPVEEEITNQKHLDENDENQEGDEEESDEEIEETDEINVIQNETKAEIIKFFERFLLSNMASLQSNELSLEIFGQTTSRYITYYHQVNQTKREYLYELNFGSKILLLLESCLEEIIRLIKDKNLHAEVVNLLITASQNKIFFPGQWELNEEMDRYWGMVSIFLTPSNPIVLTKIEPKFSENKPEKIPFNRQELNNHLFQILREISSNSTELYIIEKIIRTLKPHLDQHFTTLQNKALQTLLLFNIKLTDMKSLLIKTGCLESIIGIIVSGGMESKQYGFDFLIKFTTNGQNVEILNRFNSLRIIKVIVTRESWITLRNKALELLSNYAQGGVNYVNTIFYSRILPIILQLLKDQQEQTLCFKVIQNIVDYGEIIHIKLLTKLQVLHHLYSLIVNSDNNHTIETLSLIQNIYHKFGFMYIPQIVVIEKYKLAIDLKILKVDQITEETSDEEIESIGNSENDEMEISEEDTPNDISDKARTIGEIICKNANIIITHLYKTSPTKSLLKFRLINKQFLKTVDEFYERLEYNNHRVDQKLGSEEVDDLNAFASYLFKLKSIRFNNIELSQVFMNEFQKSFYNKERIREFMFSNCKGLTWSGFITLTISFTNVKALTFTNVKIEEYVLALILQEFSYLDTLILDNVGSAIYGISFIYLKPNFKKLSIDLKHLKSANVLLNNLWQAGNRNQLNYLTIRVNSYNGNEWFHIKSFKKLNSLSIYFSNITSVTSNSFDYLKNIRVFKIVEEEIRTKTLFNPTNFRSLCGQCGNLKALSIQTKTVFSALRSTDLASITELCPNIEKLEIKGFENINSLVNMNVNQIFIENLLKLKKLRVLYLENIPYLTTDTISSIISKSEKITYFQIKTCPLVIEEIITNIKYKANSKPDQYFNLSIDYIEINVENMPENLRINCLKKIEKTKVVLSKSVETSSNFSDAF